MKDKIRKSKYKRLTKEGEEILEHIQEQVKKERIAQGMSQRQLSFEIDRSNSWATRLEAGELLPDILDVIALSHTFKKPISYFLPARYRDKSQKIDEVILEEMKNERRKAIEALEKITEQK